MKNTYEDIVGIKRCEYCGNLKANRRVVYSFPIAGEDAKSEVCTCLTCTPKLPTFILMKLTKEKADKTFVRYMNDEGGTIHVNISTIFKEKYPNLCSPSKITFLKEKNDDTIFLYVPSSWMNFEDAEEFLTSDFAIYYDSEGYFENHIGTRFTPEDLENLYKNQKDFIEYLTDSLNNILEKEE